MPRYHFDISDGHAVTKDPEGSDLADSRAARDEAMKSIHELLATGDANGFCRRHWRMDVNDAQGSRLYSIPFSHALQADILSGSTTQEHG